MRRIILLGAIFLAACGGEGGEGGGGFQVEDYIAPELLEGAENAHQRLCIIAKTLRHARADECGVSLSSEAICEGIEMPISPWLLENEQCFEHWATAPCLALQTGECQIEASEYPG